MGCAGPHSPPARRALRPQGTASRPTARGGPRGSTWRLSPHAPGSSTAPASRKRQTPAPLRAGLQPPPAQVASGARAVRSLEDCKLPPEPRRQSRVPQSHGKARKGKARKAEGTHLAKAAQERKTRPAALPAHGPPGPNCAPRPSPALGRRPPLLPPRRRLPHFLGGGNGRYHREGGGQSRLCGAGPAQGRGAIASEGSRCQKGRGEVGSGKSQGKPVHLSAAICSGVTTDLCPCRVPASKRATGECGGTIKQKMYDSTVAKLEV